MKKIALIAILLPFTLLSQKLEYQINAYFNTQKFTISATEIINFYNNSTDTLTNILLNLPLNAFNGSSTLLANQLAYFHNPSLKFKPGYFKGFIDSVKIWLNEKTAYFQFSDNQQHIEIFLPKPIYPNDSITLKISFFTKLPRALIYTGYLAKNIQAIYWYPQIAAYYNGKWHPSALEAIQGLIYQQPADYTVTITIPKQYLIAAPGKLITESELQWLNDLSLNGLPASAYPNPADSLKTITFKAHNLTHFPILASRNYSVFKNKVNVGGRTITIWTFFSQGNLLTWLGAIGMLDSALVKVSSWLGAYPYDNLIVAEGFVANKYHLTFPEIIIISPHIKTSEALEQAIYQTLPQQWIGNYVFVDYQRTPFLVYGFSQYYLLRHIINRPFSMPYQKIATPEMKQLILNFSHYFAIDQRLNLPTKYYNDLNFAIAFNNLAPLLITELSDYLSHSCLNFDSLMQKFVLQNKLKLVDYQSFKTFLLEHCEQEQVKWFFQIVEKNKIPDYKVKLKTKKVVVKSTRPLKAPTYVKVCDRNSDSTFWLPPKRKHIINKRVNRVLLDPQFTTIDFNRYNNFDKKGLNFRLRPFISIRNYTTNPIYFFPTVFHKGAESWLFGVTFHNLTLPLHKFNFVLIPFYSYKLKEPFGVAIFNLNTVNRGIFPDVNFSFYIDRFGYTEPWLFVPKYFRKLSFSTTLTFHRLRRNDIFTKKLKLSFQQNISPYNFNPYLFDTSFVKKEILSADFWAVKNSKYHPVRIHLHFDYLRLQDIYVSWIEIEKKFHYTNLSSGLWIRLFAGRNVFLSGLTYFNDYSLSGSFLFPFYDYKEDIGNPLSHQFYDINGGFAYYGYEFPFDRYLVSLRVESTVPFVPNFVRGYGAVAYGSYTNPVTGGVVRDWFYEFGVKASIWRFRFYLPLYGTFYGLNKSFSKFFLLHYRFSINLEQVGSIESSLRDLF